MRLSKPRIMPTEAQDWGDEQKELIERLEKGIGPINVMRTLIRHPALVRRWLPFTNHVLYKSSLRARDREIVILRVAWLAKAEYEWGQHDVIARNEGLSDDDIKRVMSGADAGGWTESEAALIRAVDELEADNFITDPTWNTLARHFSEQQLMDFLFTVGNYRTLAGVLNSVGVQLDEGIPRFPK